MSTTDDKRDVSVAAIQMEVSVGDVAANIDHAERLAREALSACRHKTVEPDLER